MTTKTLTSRKAKPAATSLGNSERLQKMRTVMIDDDTWAMLQRLAELEMAKASFVLRKLIRTAHKKIRE